MSYTSTVMPEMACVYNEYVDCGCNKKSEKKPDKLCSRCGWNPEERARRLETIGWK